MVMDDVCGRRFSGNISGFGRQYLGTAQLVWSLAFHVRKPSATHASLQVAVRVCEGLLCRQDGFE